MGVPRLRACGDDRGGACGDDGGGAFGMTVGGPGRGYRVDEVGCFGLVICLGGPGSGAGTTGLVEHTGITVGVGFVRLRGGLFWVSYFVWEVPDKHFVLSEFQRTSMEVPAQEHAGMTEGEQAGMTEGLHAGMTG